MTNDDQTRLQALLPDGGKQAATEALGNDLIEIKGFAREESIQEYIEKDVLVTLKTLARYSENPANFGQVVAQFEHFIQGYNPNNARDNLAYERLYKEFTGETADTIYETYRDDIRNVAALVNSYGKYLSQYSSITDISKIPAKDLEMGKILVEYVRAISGPDSATTSLTMDAKHAFVAAHAILEPEEAGEVYESLQLTIINKPKDLNDFVSSHFGTFANQPETAAIKAGINETIDLLRDRRKHKTATAMSAMDNIIETTEEANPILTYTEVQNKNDFATWPQSSPENTADTEASAIDNTGFLGMPKKHVASQFFYMNKAVVFIEIPDPKKPGTTITVKRDVSEAWVTLKATIPLKSIKGIKNGKSFDAEKLNGSYDVPAFDARIDSYEAASDLAEQIAFAEANGLSNTNPPTYLLPTFTKQGEQVWIKMNEKTFTALRTNVDQCKNSFYKAYVDAYKKAGYDNPQELAEKHLLSEREIRRIKLTQEMPTPESGLDIERESKLIENAIWSVRLALPLRTNTKPFLQDQLDTVRAAISKKYTSLAEIYGVQSEYLAIAELRLIAAGFSMGDPQWDTALRTELQKVVWEKTVMSAEYKKQALDISKRHKQLQKLRLDKAREEASTATTISGTTRIDELQTLIEQMEDELGRTLLNLDIDLDIAVLARMELFETDTTYETAMGEFTRDTLLARRSEESKKQELKNKFESKVINIYNTQLTTIEEALNAMDDDEPYKPDIQNLLSFIKSALSDYADLTGFEVKYNEELIEAKRKLDSIFSKLDTNLVSDVALPTTNYIYSRQAEIMDTLDDIQTQLTDIPTTDVTETIARLGRVKSLLE